ncbi:MAG: phytanoyl-CoA dioxygenase family protein [Pyrinomonadaceae bacterium]|nr:phytanoyl-CoA dioxygenase family protein [Pyrinomonadaceae bacterium]
MFIPKGQIDFYEKNGYLIYPDLISNEEIKVLTEEISRLSNEKSEKIIPEKSGAVRTIFAAHQNSEIMKRLIRLPQIVETAKALLQSDVYVHQFKINFKVALEGEQWEWHQDFLYWNKEDSMPAPRVLTAAVFLDNVDDFNGPMLIIPGSHNEGMIDVEAHMKYAQNGQTKDPLWMSTLTSDLKYKINQAILSELLKKSQILSVKGNAGLVLFFHGNLFHASSQNLSCVDRQSIFISYNSMENKLEEREDPRPEFIASRNFTPIVPVSPDALLEYSR